MTIDRAGDQCLPPSDRQEEPEPLKPETATERIKRICRELGLTIQEPVTSKRKRSRLSGFERIDRIMAGLDPDPEPGSDG